MRRRRPISRPDILQVARDNLGTSEPVAVFGVLLDAAIRSTHSLLPEDVRRKAALSEAVDKLLLELERSAPVQVEQGGIGGVGFKEWREPRPALKK